MSSRIFTPAFLTVSLANLLFFTGLAGYVLLPLHLRTLGATDVELGIIMGSYSGTAIFVQPVVGAWVDRGRRRTYLVSGAVLTGAVALLFAAVPQALALFPLLRALQGAAFSVFFIANFTIVVDMVPPDRRVQALGYFGISGLTSTALGPALGEALVRAAGFRGFFVASAVMALAAAAIAARLAIPEPAGAGTAPADGVLGLLRGIAAAPRLLMTLGAVFGLGQGVIFTFFPTYATELGVSRVGFFAVAYALAALTVRATAGQLADTIGRRPVILLAMGLQAVAAALLAALAPAVLWTGVPAGVLLGLAGVLAGTAHGFLYPTLTALVVDRTPIERRGRVMGVFNSFILAGQAGGAVCFGSLAHAVGYGPMFLVLTVVLGAGWALARRLDR